MFVLPLLQWKSDKCHMFWVCVCSRRFPAFKTHSPYCHLWPVRLYNIFPHYLIKGTIFEKKVMEFKMCVLIFSTKFVWTFLILRTERDMIINIHWLSCTVPVIPFMYGTRYSFHVLLELEYSGNISEKYSNIQFHENPSSGSRFIPCRQAYGHLEMTKIIVAFGNFWTCLN